MTDDYSSYEIKMPKSYNFTPQPDITPLEAAWCAHLFASVALGNDLEDYQQWDLIKRHFTEATNDQ